MSSGPTVRTPRQLGIVPHPCTASAEDRNWDRIRENLQDIYNNFAEYGSTLVWFRLTSNLSTGSSASATARAYWPSGGGVYGAESGAADSPETITVYDAPYGITNHSPGQTRGMFQGVTGMEGIAILRENAEGTPRQFEVIWMEQYAFAIEFTLTSRFSGSDGAQTATATVTASWHQGVEPGETVTVHDDQGRWEDAPIGDKGTAWRSEYADPTHPETPYYKVISLGNYPAQEEQIPLMRFELQENLVTGGSALAWIVPQVGAGYGRGATVRVYDWWGITAQAPGNDRGMFQGIVGMEGWCRRREIDVNEAGLEVPLDEYDIVWMEQYAWAIEFTLTGSFSSGGGGVTASANVDKSWHQGCAPPSPLLIHDDQGRFPDTGAGAKGVAWRNEYEDANNPQVPYYKVVTCQRYAMRATATLAADLCSGNPVVNGWAVEPNGHFVLEDNADTRVLTNSCAHRGQAGDHCVFERTNNNPPFTWDLRDIEKHEYQLVIDVFVDEAEKALKQETLVAAVEICRDPEENIIFRFTDCPENV